MERRLEGLGFDANTMTASHFLEINDRLVALGFTRMNKQQHRRYSKNQAETGFSYSANDHTLIVWISFVEKEGKFKPTGKDAGHVIIVHKNKKVYASLPIRRTFGFIDRIIGYAEANQWKINNLPNCTRVGCKHQMVVEQNEDTRQTYYACNHTEGHTNGIPAYRSWDFRLPERFQKFLSIRRKNTKRYKKGNQKAGVVRRTAQAIRLESRRKKRMATAI